MTLGSNPNKVNTQNKYLIVDSCPKMEMKGLTKTFVSLVLGLNIKYNNHKHYFLFVFYEARSNKFIGFIYNRLRLIYLKTLKYSI